MSPYRNGISVSLVYVRCTIWALINSSWLSLPLEQGDSLIHLPFRALTARTYGWESMNLGCGFMPPSFDRSGAPVLQEQVLGTLLHSSIHPSVHPSIQSFASSPHTGG